MKKLTALAVMMIAVVTATITPSTASASNNSPLYEAADQYRDAVVDFELHVIKSRQFERYDVRLVDDLEDSTSPLRSRARNAHRNPDYAYKFESALRSVVTLHARVEKAIFHQSYSRPSPELQRCWQEVEQAYSCLILEANRFANPAPVREANFYQPSYEPRRIAPTNYVPPVAVPQRLAPQIFQPNPSFIPQSSFIPQPSLDPQQRSVDFRRRMFDHHAAMQAHIGAMLQRR